ncbi:16S rRNA (cytidine(1402)-2'-O)-methyltransferase [Oscillospiraceae bacterium MB08-C2-2]|nr:16S rRNA (cytidine(1402)-2'-O)-methyltransferase [Oscillospiraceae bacterium MB08-C2-2]
MSKLYLVGTPIGNLGDISPRALQTLETVDFIAAEDTRVTLKLLRHFSIGTPMVSYYEHNQQYRGEQIVARILAGESCAVVTDAGMPCISDPGEGLVAQCAEAGIETVVVPGPSAVVSALCLSGIATGRFTFEGFLTVNRNGRLAHLEEVRNDPRTLIFYEAPHKLLRTLEDMLAVWGDRPLALCRELTKLHEEVIRTTLAEAVALYTSQSPRGEYVLVVEGAPPKEETPLSFEEAVAMVCSLQKGGLPTSQAAKEIAKETGYKKGDLYKAALEQFAASSDE